MASNPHINRVVYGTTVLVDLTDTTATAADVMSGKGCYGADGAWIDGAATSDTYTLATAAQVHAITGATGVTS